MKLHRHRGIRRLMWGFVAVTGLSVLMMGCRHPRNMSPEEKAEWVQEKATDKLDLNANQQASLKALSAEVVALAKEMKTERKSRYNEVLAQLDNPELDTEAIKEAMDARRGLIDERRDSILNKLADFYATLSDEQRAEVKEFVQKWRERHQPDEE